MHPFPCRHNRNLQKNTQKLIVLEKSKLSFYTFSPPPTDYRRLITDFPDELHERIHDHVEVLGTDMAESVSGVAASDTGTAARFQIRIVVTDDPGISQGGFRLLHRKQYAFRFRLQGILMASTKNNVEKLVELEMPEDFFAFFIRFVAGNGDLPAVPVEQIESLPYAGIKMCPDEHVVAVMLLELLERSLVRGRTILHGPLHEFGSSVTYIFSDSLNWQRTESVVGTHEVYAGGKILARINEGPVQVAEQQMMFMFLVHQFIPLRARTGEDSADVS